MAEKAATTSVETDTSGYESVDAKTVLTDETTDTNSDAGENSSVKNAAGADENSDAGDAGEKDSDTPPDTYADFAMPDGVTLDESALSEVTPIFKELGLNQEQAQKLIDVYAAQVQAGSQAQIDNFNQLMSDWRDKSRNDSEFGGDKFEENVKIAQSAINKYGTPELKQLLEEHGVGNHPEVVRFMVRIGKTLKEDVPGSSGAVSSKAEDRVSLLYPNSK